MKAPIATGKAGWLQDDLILSPANSTSMWGVRFRASLYLINYIQVKNYFPYWTTNANSSFGL